MKRVNVQTVSSLSESRIPHKCEDPGTFTIPCTIGQLTIANALLDVGVCIM